MNLIIPTGVTLRSPGEPAEDQVDLTPAEAEALAFLLPLSADYPGIERWYKHKVVPGLKDGSRTLLRVVRNDELVGLGIAKKEPEERKICTVRVAPSYVGRGMGLRIFDGLLNWLQVDKPYFTINEYKKPVFDKIFDHYGFQATSEKSGLYLPNTIELGYNEQDSSGT